jgi:hypothetical protein
MIGRPVSGMQARKDVNKRSDQKLFKKTVDRTHYINTSHRPAMRGGVRL